MMLAVHVSTVKEKDIGQIESFNTC